MILKRSTGALAVLCILTTMTFAEDAEPGGTDTCELLFSASVDENSFKALEQEWLAGCETGQPVTLIVTSSGGDPDVGAAMHDWITNKGWNTVAAGKVYSAAVPIFLAGEHRTAMRNSLILIHPGALYLQEKMTDREMEEARVMDSHQDRIYNEIISLQSGLTIEVVDQMVQAHTFLTATEAVEKGFAHTIK